MDYFDRNYEHDKEVPFSVLKGKTIKEIENLEKGSEQVFFHCNDGSKFKMTYYHDCCATCDVEDVAGDVKDLIGSEILMAEEISSTEPDETILAERKSEYEKTIADAKAKGREPYYDSFEQFLEYRHESETWTFLKLATLKGYVTIRWYGSSNGYYSESPTFEQVGVNQ